MNRKEFCRRIGGGALAGCAGCALNGQETAADKEKQAREAERKFHDDWLQTLMENLEAVVDEKTRVTLMEKCGRACAKRGGFFRLADSHKGDVRKFVAAVAEKMGSDFARIEGDTVHWTYPRCFCEMAASGPATLPAVYCQCSVGWVKEIFDLVAGKPVQVELLQSVKRGAPSCKFLIRV